MFWTLHLLAGLILAKLFGNPVFILMGTFFPDIDHLYVYFFKGRINTIRNFIGAYTYEEDYGLRSKTPFFHSIFGAFFFSIILAFFYFLGALFFCMAYLIHLLIDLPDKDVKRFLYPHKKEYKGSIFPWSEAEQILTIAVFMIAIVLYLA